MYAGCRFRASSSSPVPERPPESKRSRRNRLRERVASLAFFQLGLAAGINTPLAHPLHVRPRGPKRCF